MAPDILAQAIELQRKCFTHEQIAATLGFSRETVTRALARHNQRVLNRLESRSAAERGKQAEQLGYVAGEAMRGWERSQLDAETVKTVEDTVEVEGREMSTVKTERTVKGQAGDPAFLREVRGALADIRKMLGLDAADLPDDAAGTEPLSPEEEDALGTLIGRRADRPADPGPGPGDAADGP